MCFWYNHCADGDIASKRILIFSLPAGRQARVLASILRLVYMLAALLQSGFAFFHHFVGIIISPYETYRDIENAVARQKWYISVFLVGLFFSFKRGKNSFISSAPSFSVRSFYSFRLWRWVWVHRFSAGFDWAIIGATDKCRTHKSSVGVHAHSDGCLVFVYLTFVCSNSSSGSTQITGVLLSIVYLVVSAMIFGGN